LLLSVSWHAARPLFQAAAEFGQKITKQFFVIMKVGGKFRDLKSIAQTKRPPEGDLSVALTEARLRAVTADHGTAPSWRAIHLRSTPSLCEAKKLARLRGTPKALRRRHEKAHTG
jgi:hypothetical protein